MKTALRDHLSEAVPKYELGTVVKQSDSRCRLPGVMTRDRPETDADLGTLLDGDRGFSGVSSWWAIRREAPRRKDGLVPVLLLRSRMRRRLETIPSTEDGQTKSTIVFCICV